MLETNYSGCGTRRHQEYGKPRVLLCGSHVGFAQKVILHRRSGFAARCELRLRRLM